MTRTVEDCALMLNAMAGYDARDPASARVPVEDFSAKLGQSIAGMRVGVLRSWYTPGTVTPVAAAVDTALDVFRSLGATVTDVEIPSIELVTASSAIMMPEAFAYHEADLRETPELYAASLRNRFLTGSLYLAHEYVQAQRARAILKAEVADLLHEVDLLVTPTTPTTAPTFEQAYGEFFRRGPHYTSIYNLTGLPALSIPCGFDDNGLPIGLQIAGRPFAEATVLQAGHAYERETGWHRRHPSV
jgi:aspartyl-tRNA(Asn)/glutamyl-tRNA(Gln) amidotransferase subunit A